MFAITLGFVDLLVQFAVLNVDVSTYDGRSTLLFWLIFFRTLV